VIFSHIPKLKFWNVTGHENIQMNMRWTHWDGLLSMSSAKILVLAATNRPFDLDEAIVRPV
jgi:SpoVK/Ycf46/Vps4 family AAA+-type ATPase